MRPEASLSTGGDEWGTRDGKILLRVQDVRLVFDTYRGRVHALSGVNLSLFRGRITGLAGETGCGKSVTAKTILQLLPKTARILGGQIWFEEQDLLRKTDADMETVRGNTIAMIFQNPRAALNPLFTVEQQMYFLLHRHQQLDRRMARMRTLELLRAVGIGDPVRRLKSYPFELSTGMCQRVMIGMGLACQPKLLIADEPTTGLDVTIQAQVLDLFSRLVYDTGATAMIITHDLGVISETCEYMGVMYAGQMVEFAATSEVVGSPVHPYTRGLLRSCLTGEESDALHYIAGTVPSLYSPPEGCAFAPRCPVREDCPPDEPPTVDVGNGHTVKCWRVGDVFPERDQT